MNLARRHGGESSDLSGGPVDPAMLAELHEFLGIPSVSADPARAMDVARAGQWVCDYVRAAGGTSELLDWAGQPLAVGEIPASFAPADAPTVMIYGHFDVQTPEPVGRWISPPFEATVHGGWLYARGAADDKGQLYLLLKAARDLAAAGALPVNVRVCCDGEEETGGQSIVDFLARDDQPVDACVIFDMAMPAEGVPAFTIATRGLMFFRLRLETGSRDLHSGLYGGAALNAFHALEQTLAALLPRNGRLHQSLYAGIVDPAACETDAWNALPCGADVLANAGALPADPAAAEEFYLRTWAWPSLEVHGLAGGSIAQKTIVPAVAEAAFSIRLAIGQQVEAITTAVTTLLRQAAPAGAEVALDVLAATPAAVLSPDAPAIALGLDAFERTLGVRPLLVRSGGSLPIVATLQQRGIPALVTGFDVPDGNIHAPNERLLLRHIPLGTAAAREVLVALGTLAAR